MNNTTEMKNIYTNEVVAQIRKKIKSVCRSLKVTQKGLYIHVDGSDGEHGYFTPVEKQALIDMGLMPHQNMNSGLSISIEERKYLVEKWGIEA